MSSRTNINQIPTCNRRLGRGQCRNEATAMVNGEPRCADHTPRASEKYDVMPIQVPEALPPCACGCGLSVTRKRSSYKQGHDMKHRSQLLRRVREMADAEAAGLLVRKGWKMQTEMETELEKSAEKLGGVTNSEEDPDDDTDRPVDHMGLRFEAVA